MNTATHASRVFIGAVTAIALLITPSLAAAGSPSVLTKQVLPPGSNTCAPLFAKSVTPYIYNGELDSFDIELSNASYVGILGAAGDVSIPFSYMTRRYEPDGTLLLHVDTTVRINGAVPVTITLMSALPGAPVCLSTVSFTTDAQGNINASNPITVTPSPVDTGMGSDTDTTAGTGVVRGGGPVHTVSTGPNGGTITQPIVGSTSSTSTSLSDVVAKMCTKNGSYQLWFILLAIFFVIAAFVGLSEPALAVRHGGLPAALIGIPLVLLLLFWMFASDCRLSYFIPVILLVAAAIGLYSAYRTSPVMRPVMELPAEKKTTTVMTTEEKK